MPGRNGQGPLGQGPMTGRGQGPCCGYAARGAGYGQAMGRRAGRGCYGFGYNRPVTLTADDQKNILMDRKAFLEQELEDLQKSINEL